MVRPIRPAGGSPLGVTPTAAQKLQHIANKLGITGIKGMQGSTMNIVDTVLLSTNASNRQTLSFFTQTQGKSRNFSNFQNGSLNAGEAMVIETVSFFLLTLSATTLSADGTTISSMTPLPQVVTGQVGNNESLQLGLLNITIANQKVVKDFNTYEINPNQNPNTQGIALGNLLTSADAVSVPETVIGSNRLPLEAAPVLPPNQKIEVSLELPPIGTVTGNLAIMCVLGRFGCIFASKTTL